MEPLDVEPSGERPFHGRGAAVGAPLEIVLVRAVPVVGSAAGPRVVGEEDDAASPRVIGLRSLHAVHLVDYRPELDVPPDGKPADEDVRITSGEKRSPGYARGDGDDLVEKRIVPVRVDDLVVVRAAHARRIGEGGNVIGAGALQVGIRPVEDPLVILARVPHEENVLHPPAIETVLDISLDRVRVREPAVELVVDVFDVREEHAVALAPPPGDVIGAARHEIPVRDDERLIRPCRFAETRRRVDGNRAHREALRAAAAQGDEPARRERFVDVDYEPVAAPDRGEIGRPERAIRRGSRIRDIDEKAAVRRKAGNRDRGVIDERIEGEFEPVAARDEERRVFDREIVDEILVVGPVVDAAR